MTARKTPAVVAASTGARVRASTRPQPYSRPSPISKKPLRSAFSPVAGLSGPPRGEESDAYPTIAALNTRWRIVTCKNSLQWVLQRRCGHVDHWRGFWFCRSREALIRGAREHAGQIAGNALIILLRLPEHFQGTAP